VGGEFIRTESGRYDPIYAADRSKRSRSASAQRPAPSAQRPSRGAQRPLLANISRASRKDLREAVRTARTAQPGWASKSAYLKGQILYRMAEMLEGRAASFEKLLRETRALSAAAATREVRASIDRLVHYAGWSDKYVALLGTVNPVASSYFDFSVPEPMGVVGIVVPEEPDLLGLVSHLAPVLVSGNSAVVLLSQRHPLASLELAEVIATSDLPAGVANLLSGHKDELVPHLARHMDVLAIADASGEAALSKSIASDAAVNVKRVRRYQIPDYFAEAAQGLDFIEAFTEIKTTWHPIGV
ncbi:MAG TPA: aldehyde dehydrogenase family protein, partial [Thermoanaerobaculia bacterium]|nr:aldehyde dehydrogenase family protein [Thermoanaerobaculia bacterium]